MDEDDRLQRKCLKHMGSRDRPCHNHPSKWLMDLPWGTPNGWCCWWDATSWKEIVHITTWAKLGGRNACLFLKTGTTKPALFSYESCKLCGKWFRYIKTCKVKGEKSEQIFKMLCYFFPPLKLLPFSYFLCLGFSLQVWMEQTVINGF